MDAATARERVTASPVARLATITAEGRPHLVPCCFAVDDDWIFSVVDAKAKSRLALRRLDNIRAHPEVALLVDHYDEDWSDLWWVRVDGRAQIWDSGDARRPATDRLAAKYRQYRHTPPPGAVIAVEITGWRWWP